MKNPETQIKTLALDSLLILIAEPKYYFLKARKWFGNSYWVRKAISKYESIFSIDGYPEHSTYATINSGNKKLSINQTNNLPKKIVEKYSFAMSMSEVHLHRRV